MPSAAQRPSRAASACSRARQPSASPGAIAAGSGIGAGRAAAASRRRRPGATASACASSASSRPSMPPSARARTMTTRGFQASAVGAAAQAEHLAHLARRLLGQRQVALADREQVGDLERAGFQRLDVVAEPGRTDDDAGVGERGDPRFRLAGADGLDDDPVEAGGVEAVDRRPGRARQAAELAAGGKGADEGVRMGAVLAHPDPVAEDGAAADRARRIEGDDRDLQAALAARRRAGRSPASTCRCRARR